MKHLKIFENYQTEEEVAKICQEYGIKNWSINKDGLVDVNNNVDLSNKQLTKLPLKFGIVTGYFNCSFNNLKTLEGAPQSVSSLYCIYNKLTTLEAAPQSVSGHFYCSHNNLTNLEGSPKLISVSFWCSYNKLTTLEGAPESVGNHFFCSDNNLTTLNGSPYLVGGDFNCNNNPLPDLIQNNMKWIKHIIANQEMYHIYNKDGSLNEYRFQLMMDSMD